MVLSVRGHRAVTTWRNVTGGTLLAQCLARQSIHVLRQYPDAFGRVAHFLRGGEFGHDGATLVLLSLLGNLNTTCTSPSYLTVTCVLSGRCR